MEQMVQKIVFGFGLIFLLMTEAWCTTYSLPNGTLPLSCSKTNTTTVTCSSDVTIGWNDKLELTSAVTMIVNGNFTSNKNPNTTNIGNGGTFVLQVSGNFTATQILSMTGTLNVTGDVSIAPSSTIIGDITAGGVCTINSSSSVSGNITANSIAIKSSGTTITGSLNSASTLSLESGSTINGNVSGTVITTGSPVTINGNVTASTSFVLASGSVVNGSVVAPTITLQSSSGYIRDDVTTSDITLGWATRVKGTIYCTNASPSNGCTCVTNNSGTATNVAGYTACQAATILPIAEYRMDECSWNSTSGEVKDSSSNGYNGTLKKKTMSLGNSKLCRGPADFNDDSYVELTSFPNLTSNMTITAWFKTTNIAEVGQRIFADDASNSNGYALSVGDGGSGTIRFFDRSQSNSGIIDSDAVLQNDTWYFVAGVTDVTNAKRYLYVYNSSGTLVVQKNATMSNTSRGIDSGVATIGGEADSGETANRFKGSIDEVKVFATALSQSQILSIVQNERDGKNYDGTTRLCSVCGLSTCYTDDFGRASLGSKWSIISTGTYPPNITDNKLMLTQNINNISSGVSLIGNFPSANNLVEIQFEHNAYAGNGADGVTVILSDANTTPIAGGFGGSLGYSPKDSTLGFAGAWLGFGLDEYGNFANDNDGNQGRGCSYRPTTRILDSVTIRGRGEVNRLNGYCFIANSGNLETLTGTGIDSAASTTPAPKNKYKFTIDTRSGTKITVKRDINDGNGYVTLPNMNEINATQAAIAPENFKLSFTGSTGGSRNYHSFDDLSIKALYCGTLGKDQNNTNSYFDAWEVGAAYNISNRSIQTKIVKSNFNLNIFALNENNTAYQDFNGTVCVRLVDNNDKNITSWSKLLFNQANPYVNLATFNSSYASKDVRVALSWKKNVDTTCPLSVEDNTTKSTDHFAIRPNKFTIANATTAYAGENFTLDFKALNALNTNSLEYNETKDGTFTIASVIGKIGCNNGILNVSNFSFADGQKLAVDSNFSDVGDINITIAEKSTFEFAKIDASDTSDINRLISPATLVVSIKPYELNITDANFTASTAKSWLYDANVSDMYVTAHATVQANNKQHSALQNFTNACYAQPVDLTFYYDANNTNINTNISYTPLNGILTSLLKPLSDINKTITIPTTLFTTASASADYRFNVDRAYNFPLSPIDIALKEVKVTSTTVAKNENNATVNQSKRFYYGRVKAKDIVTDKTTVPHLLHVEVYSPVALSGFYQNTLNWFINGDDDGTTVFSDNNFSENKGFINNQPSTSVAVANTVSLSDGILKFNINNLLGEQSSTIHVDIPTWLWNSNVGEYNTSLGSTCANHPCFNYKYIKDVDTVGIKSGTTKGSTISSDYNASYQKSGVKTFR